MDRHTICEGIHLLLDSNILRVPAGTLAIVESVSTLYNGDWFFTVRWIGLPAGSQSRPGLGSQSEPLGKRPGVVRGCDRAGRTEHYGSLSCRTEKEEGDVTGVDGST